VSAYRDAELEGLGDEQGWDPDLRDLAQFMRSSSRAYAHVEPSARFRQDLRRRLMREAWAMASRPPQPWYRRLLAPQPMAMAGALVGAVLIVTVAFLSLGPQPRDHVNVGVVSPQQNAQLEPAVKPIVLEFSTSMDTASVRYTIDPPILLAPDQWDQQHRVLTLTPVNALSPTTRYVVKVTSARTAQSQPVAVSKIKPVVFSTGPVPTPTPSTGPRPTPAPSPVLNPRDLGPVVSGGRVHWSIDGANLFVIAPSGAFEELPVAGGTAQKVAEGASLAAVAPDGSAAWLSGGQVTWKSTTVSGVQPVALGFRASTLLMATGADVETADQRRVAAFKETATAAEFSPAGDRVAYIGGSGLHVVDLTSGADTTVGAASSLGAWGPDGVHYAYVTGSGVSVADASAGTTAPLVNLPGVTGVSWSGSEQQLLLTASGALYLAAYGSGGTVTAQRQTTAADGTFSAPQWAPNGSGQFSFIRGGDVWVARLQTAAPGAPLITQITPGQSQLDLVNSFMNARKNGSVEQALLFLDAAGRDAFSRLNLVYSDPSLARYYVLLSQPGRVVVRMVLANGSLVQTAVDETLLIQPDTSNRPYIHSVTDTPRLSFGTGPEVLSTTVSANQVQIVFDSDLDPSSAVKPGAVGIVGVTTTATYRSKTVTLTVPGGLTPGQSYDLSISPTLQDLNQRQAVQYDLTFNGPLS
jgi:Bacterial Ig-like domain